MAKRNDKEISSENYTFIKETIKEQPTKTGLPAKILTAALCGVIFGSCATCAMALIVPKALEKLGSVAEQKAVVTLTPAAKESLEQETPALQLSEEKKETATEKSQDNLSDGISQIAEMPRRALVRISAAGEDADLLDDSFLDYGEGEGFVFLKNSDAFYILTLADQMDEADKFTVTFSDETTADGILCKNDFRTGLMVIKVPFASVGEETQEEIPAVSLASEDDMKQTDAVIAIGSPTGDYDSLIAGTIAAVTGTLKIADEEYGMLTTDMAGDENSRGILLNEDSEVVGIIWNQEENRTNVIRAVETAQLCPLLESMANSEDIRYIGIEGVTISSVQSESLEIPRGIYVDYVEVDSPAMSAGIQNGDILHTLDGQEIQSMEEYASVLQGLSKGTSTKVNVYRKNPSGEYTDVELAVKVTVQ